MQAASPHDKGPRQEAARTCIVKHSRQSDASAHRVSCARTRSGQWLALAFATPCKLALLLCWDQHSWTAVRAGEAGASVGRGAFGRTGAHLLPASWQQQQAQQRRNQRRHSDHRLHHRNVAAVRRAVFDEYGAAGDGKIALCAPGWGRFTETSSAEAKERTALAPGCQVRRYVLFTPCAASRAFKAFKLEDVARAARGRGRGDRRGCAGHPAPKICSRVHGRRGICGPRSPPGRADGLQEPHAPGRLLRGQVLHLVRPEDGSGSSWMVHAGSARGNFADVRQGAVILCDGQGQHHLPRHRRLQMA